MADSKLQKSPYGLLGVFDLKTLGDNPNLFGERMQPVFESIEPYLIDRFQVLAASDSVALGTQGISVFHTVPRGQAWRVLGVGARFDLDAADTAFVVRLRGQLGPSTSSLMPFLPTQIGASLGPSTAGLTARWYFQQLDSPLWWPAGWIWECAVNLSGNSTSARTFTTYVLAQVITE